jgi:ferric-dicitrate binding protein FerR (iron transport regulator)
MDCEQAQSYLVADMDRELSRDDRACLEAHLQGCAGCRATTTAFRQQDAELRRAFGPRRQAATRVANRVIADLGLAAPRTRRLPWFAMVASAAAGFLLAAVLFRPWQAGQPRPPLPVPVDEESAPSVPALELAQLAVASQAVQIMLPGENQWQPLKAGGSVQVGTRVRTPANVRCEFTTLDGSEVRLNGGTELVFSALRQLDLTRGQIMTRIAPGQAPFQVQIPDSIISALAAEFDLLCQPAETLLLVLQGAAQVTGKAKGQEIRSGHQATIIKGQVSKTEPVNELAQVMTTRWVNEILMLKGRDNPELTKRVNDILAQLGQLKGDFLDESEMRGLGDRCVLPLTRYLQSPRSQRPELQRRRAVAAHIVADLAQPWSIPDLIELLIDRDEEVRYWAALGLRRLTGRTLDFEPEQWREADAESRQKVYQQWKLWWQKNKSRYPGGA